MRRIGGFEVLKWLREQEKFTDTLVVVLSGHGELENVRLAYQSGARSFLTKPCHLDDVKNLVEVYGTYWETHEPEAMRAAEPEKVDGQLGA
jgi:DNA-binding response OmpR family regulator